MKKSMLALVLGALVASTSAMASPAPFDEHHDDAHPAIGHDRGSSEGWYKKGGKVPQDYRDSRYVVTNYNDYHLAAPRRGYHWVRSDNGEFLQVAIATGVIASIVAGQ